VILPLIFALLSFFLLSIVAGGAAMILMTTGVELSWMI
jgi:hypothetical protein